MNKRSDVELQELIDQGIVDAQPPLSADDLQALETYGVLFEALDKQPQITLPPDFACNITTVLLDRKNRRAEVNLYLSIAAVLIFLVAGVCFYFARSGTIQGTSLVLTLTKWKWELLFVAVAFGVIQYADQKFIHAYRFPKVTNMHS